jgi:hypothetical protein
MKKPVISQKQFEYYLNSNGPRQGSDKWIIGGKIRMAEMWINAYGTALRKYEPSIFRKAFNEYLQML